MANDAVKGEGIVRWRRCGWYPLLSAHLAPSNQGFPPGSAFPIALAGPWPRDLLSRVSKNHKSLQRRLTRTTPPHPDPVISMILEDLESRPGLSVVLENRPAILGLLEKR